MANTSLYASIFLLARFVRREVFTTSTAAISRVDTLPFEAVFVPLGGAAILGLAVYAGLAQLAPLRPRPLRSLGACCAAAAASTIYAFVEANPVLATYDPSLVHYALAPLLVVAVARSGYLGRLDLLGSGMKEPKQSRVVQAWIGLVVLVALAEMVCTSKGVSRSHILRTLGHWFWTPRTLSLLVIGSGGCLLSKIAAESCDRPGDSKVHHRSPWLLQPRKMFTGLLVLYVAEAALGLLGMLAYSGLSMGSTAGSSGGEVAGASSRFVPDVKELMFALMGRGIDFDPVMALLLLALHTLERTAFWVLLTVAPLAPTLSLICCAEMIARGYGGDDMSFLVRAMYFAIANAGFVFIVVQMTRDAAQSRDMAHTFSPVANEHLEPWSTEDMEEVDLERGQRRRRVLAPPTIREESKPAAGAASTHPALRLPVSTLTEGGGEATTFTGQDEKAPVSPLASASEKPPRPPGRRGDKSVSPMRRPRPRMSPTRPAAATDATSYSVAVEED